MLSIRHTRSYNLFICGWLGNATEATESASYESVALLDQLMFAMQYALFRAHAPEHYNCNECDQSHA
jgi:hypothetical protein